MTKPNQSELSRYQAISILESILRNARHCMDYDRQIHMKIAELRKMSVEDSIKLSQKQADRATAEELIGKANLILERLTEENTR